MDETKPPTLQEIRLDAIAAAVRRNNGSVAAAAVELDVSQKTIYNNLPRDAEGNILWDRLLAPEPGQSPS